MADEQELYIHANRLIKHAKQAAVYTALQQQLLILENEPFAQYSGTFRRALMSQLRLETDQARRELEHLVYTEPLPVTNMFIVSENRPLHGIPRMPTGDVIPRLPRNLTLPL